jgi:hypothetical protein
MKQIISMLILMSIITGCKKDVISPKEPGPINAGYIVNCTGPATITYTDCNNNIIVKQITNSVMISFSEYKPDELYLKAEGNNLINIGLCYEDNYSYYEADGNSIIEKRLTIK